MFVDALVRCPIWRCVWRVFSRIWTSQTVDFDVVAIFFVMDLDGVRKIRGNNVCDRIHRWFLLFDRINGHTGKPLNFEIDRIAMNNAACDN